MKFLIIIFHLQISRYDMNLKLSKDGGLRDFEHSMNMILAAQKMKFSIKDFFSKCDQIRSFVQIRSHLTKKSLLENFIFCPVLAVKKLVFGSQQWLRFHTLTRLISGIVIFTWINFRGFQGIFAYSQKFVFAKFLKFFYPQK